MLKTLNAASKRKDNLYGNIVPFDDKNVKVELAVQSAMHGTEIENDCTKVFNTKSPSNSGNYSFKYLFITNTKLVYRIYLSIVNQFAILFGK